MLQRITAIIPIMILITILLSISPNSGARSASDIIDTDNSAITDSGPHGTDPGSGTASETTGTTVEAEKRLVVLDAGHGGKDGGTSSGTLLEKDINLDICLKIEEILKESGNESIEVMLTRKDDTFVDVLPRSKDANSRGADLFVSIHCNAFRDKRESGITLFYMPRGMRCGDLTDSEFAEIIHAGLATLDGLKDRGIVDHKHYSVINAPQMPSVLIELGFLSNSNDAALLGSSSFRTEVAQVIARQILFAIEQS